MKSFIKYVALGMFIAASAGMVACENNTVSLKAPKTSAGAPAAAQGEVQLDGDVDGKVSEDKVKVDEESGEEIQVADYRFAMLDRLGSNTGFSIRGELNTTLEDAQYFNEFQGTRTAYVVRVAPFGHNGGGYRDFAFIFNPLTGPQTGTIVDNPVLYLSKEAGSPFFYNSNIEVPNLAELATKYGTRTEALMVALADFIDRQQPVIREMVPPHDLSGNSLSSNVMALWLVELEDLFATLGG